LLRIDRRLLQNFDWTLFALAAVLVAIGMVNLVSATHTGDGISDEVRRQLISLGIGSALLLVTLAIDYRHFERLALPIFALSLLLLVATLALAPVTRGSQSWLFGGRVQPSEIAKLGMVLALARYFQRNPPGEIRQLRDLAQPAASCSATWAWRCSRC
jgi:rod shape determining protein RodA